MEAESSDQNLLNIMGRRLYRNRFIYRDSFANILVECEDSVYHELKRLMPFTSFWLKQLGLGNKHCLLFSEINPELPPSHILDGSGCVAVFTEDCREVRLQEDFDLIMIGFQASSAKRLKGYLSKRCPDCKKHIHANGQHTVLHELVHVAYPEYSTDNEWTDQKVEELFLTQSGG